MNANDIIGSAGVGLILLAYFLSTEKLLKQDSKMYFCIEHNRSRTGYHSFTADWLLAICDTGRNMDISVSVWAYESNENTPDLIYRALFMIIDQLNRCFFKCITGIYLLNLVQHIINFFH